MNMILIGESCWWTIHPSSKQRSEGEKVRVGDDAILVSVATERYLVISLSLTIGNYENIFISVIELILTIITFKT